MLRTSFYSLVGLRSAKRFANFKFLTFYFFSFCCPGAAHQPCYVPWCCAPALLCALVLRTSLVMCPGAAHQLLQPRPCASHKTKRPSEGPLCLRPILDDSHFKTACDTSNMTSDYSRSYTLTRREQGPSSPLRSLFAAKLVGRWGDGPRFAGGADANFGILSNSRFGAVFEFYLYPIKVKLGKID